ncbi:MAG: M20/M25/M40 family metallo-hydrolase [Steroidobacteraceae bacterium]
MDQFIADSWDRSIVPVLTDYIRIPNKSPLFAPDWAQLGHMDKAVELFAGWCRAQEVPGMTVEVQKLPGRTPLLLVDIPGQRDDVVLLYGHLDKQPEFTGWNAGLGPWEPVMRSGRLYGRGGADDGYALFSSLCAIMALQRASVSLPRCVIVIEASEESGSIDLPAHLAALGKRLGKPSLVVCLDAECGNYDQLWCTTSLRGNLTGTLRVQVLKEGVHSGMGTGIAPTPFRIVQQVLARLEDPATGELLVEELRAEIPGDRSEEATLAAAVLGPEIAGKLPFCEGARAVDADPRELVLNNTWRGTLAITGAEGLPPIASAGNVLLPEISLKLSLRLAPTTDAAIAAAAVKRVLESQPPYGAKVTFEVSSSMQGWNAPSLAPWLARSMERASQLVYGKSAVFLGCGGSIPFMAMLGEIFPETQFFITGVLGPHSNAHGPNEFLHVPYAKQLTHCVAEVLRDHANRDSD